MPLKLNKISVLIIFSLVCRYAFAQMEDGKALWDKQEIFADTGSAFIGEDLVVLMFNHTLYSSPLKNYPDYFKPSLVSYYGYSPVSIEIMYMQMYVRNLRGAQMVWQMKVPVLNDRILYSIKLRNRKPSGEVIALPEEDIYYVMTRTSKPSSDETDYSLLPVPGADAGDIIDILAVYYVPHAVQSDHIYFHLSYPVCHSEFLFNHSPDYYVTLRRYNFPDFHPEVSKPDELTYCFSFDSLPGLYSQAGLLAQFELPFVAIRIDSIEFKINKDHRTIQVIPHEWNQMLKETLSEISNSVPGFSYTELIKSNNFFDQFARRYPDLNKNQLAVKWHEFLNDSVSIRFVTRKERETPLEEWLKQRTTDRSRLFKAYIEFFNYYHINYSFYLSRWCGDGYLDSTFVCPGKGMTCFFGIPDSVGTMFLYPPSELETYEAGELPVGLRGSVAVGYQPLARKPETEYIQIPAFTKMTNRKKRNFECVIIDPDTSRIVINQRNYFYGDVGKYLAILYNQLFTGENDTSVFANFFVTEPGNIVIKSLSIDEKTSTRAKLSFRLNYECDNFLTTHSDGSYSFRIDRLVPLDILPSSPYPRTYGFYLPSPYANESDFYLRFDRKIELQDNNSLPRSYSNGFGSIRLNVKTIDDRIILVEAGYSIDADYLPAADFWQVDDLEQKAGDLLGRHIFFRFRE